jgi:hypothetical protein
VVGIGAVINGRGNVGLSILATASVAVGFWKGPFRGAVAVPKRRWESFTTGPLFERERLNRSAIADRLGMSRPTVRRRCVVAEAAGSRCLGTRDRCGCAAGMGAQRAHLNLAHPVALRDRTRHTATMPGVTGGTYDDAVGRRHYLGLGVEATVILEPAILRGIVMEQTPTPAEPLVTTSWMPSPFRSPTATSIGVFWPTSNVGAATNVPSPRPKAKAIPPRS